MDRSIAEVSTTIDDFYDQLAPFYHLIYPDWEASIERQASALDSILREIWGDRPLAVLDVACGIGTQTLGLASRCHVLTASDLSAAAVERAKREAAERSLSIEFGVADMRELPPDYQARFDVVIACDNAVPHLLCEADILTAFRQMLACLRPGGGCLITVRDYDREERSGVQVKPYGIRVENVVRYLLFQVWEFQGALYDLSMYFVEDRGEANCPARVLRSKYYAIGVDTLMALMEQAGFHEVRRIDDRFYQPVVLGIRPSL